MSTTYFTDRDLGKRFPAALRAAGIFVEEHAAHFRHDTPDDEWIPEVARRGWIAVSHDARIRYKPNEKDAVLQSGLGLIILVGKVPHDQLAQNFIDSIARIDRFVGTEPKPFIAKLYLPGVAKRDGKESRGGRIERWV